MSVMLSLLTALVMIKNVSDQTALINQKYTDRLQLQMTVAGEALDNYQMTHDNTKRIAKQITYFTPRDELVGNDAVEKARYWLTYAHEAIAYQAAKKYTFGANISKSSAHNKVAELKADLGSIKQKTDNAQKMVDEALKNP